MTGNLPPPASTAPVQNPLSVAVASDIPALHRLIESAYRGEAARAGWTHEADLLGGQRTDARALGDMIADPGQRVLLLGGNDGMTGCVAIADKGAGLAYLGMLTVAPGAQASGVGRMLITAAETCARAAFGARSMEMTVIAQRTELIAWYLRCGYALTGEERPFPYGDERFGRPTVTDLRFVVLARALG